MKTEDKACACMFTAGAIVIAVCLFYLPSSWAPDPTADLARCEALYQVKFKDITKDHIEKDHPNVRYYEVRGRGSNSMRTFGYVSHFYGRWNYASRTVSNWGVEYTSSYGRWEHSHHSRSLDECLTYMGVQ